MKPRVILPLILLIFFFLTFGCSSSPDDDDEREYPPSQSPAETNPTPTPAFPPGPTATPNPDQNPTPSPTPVIVIDELSILYLSATFDTIALRGTGGSGRSEFTRLTFRVEDENGSPVEDVDVDFVLTPTTGGLAIDVDSAVTDAQGLVQVNIMAGTAATTFSVKASITNTEIYTTSDNLVVSTGLPDQDSFSLSLERYNPEAWNTDGVTVAVTVRAADHFNNPIPDGTQIYFTTDGGAIDPNCSMQKGACTVNWTSQDPRPDDDDGPDSSRDRRGIVTILAVAVGEESFTDMDGDGRYSSAEDQRAWESSLPDPWIDLPEAHLDIDGDYVYDDGTIGGVNEAFRDFDSDGEYDEPNGIYNGSLCTEAMQAEDNCSRSMVEVRDVGRLVMSNGYVAHWDLRAEEIIISDLNGNSLPGGTKIQISPKQGVVINPTNFKVENLNTGPNHFTFSNYLKSDTTSHGSYTIEVTSPSGLKSTNSY